MSLATTILEKYGKKKNEQSDSAIAELKKIDFKSTEDRAKAAQLIKGLLLSSDPEAKEFTKELEDLIDDMKAGPDVDESAKVVKFKDKEGDDRWTVEIDGHRYDYSFTSPETAKNVLKREMSKKSDVEKKKK